MNLVVEGLDSEAAEIGLTEESIGTAAESRLRAARLFSPESSQHLYINIRIYKPAVNMSVRFYKTVHDSLSDLRFLAVT